MNPISKQITDLELGIEALKRRMPYADSRQAREADQEQLKRLQTNLLYWRGVKAGITAIQYQVDLCEKAAEEYNDSPKDLQVESRYFAKAFDLRLTAQELCKTALKDAA